MRSLVTELKNSLINDINYLKYDEIYKNENIIDKDLLIKLLEDHLDFYIVFLKLNIFLWRYDTRYANKELKDYKHYKGKILRIDDIDTVYRYYYKNYNRTRSAMKKIICYRLRPMNELIILKRILARPIEEEIYPINEFEEQIKSENDKLTDKEKL